MQYIKQTGFFQFRDNLILVISLRIKIQYSQLINDIDYSEAVLLSKQTHSFAASIEISLE